MVIDFSSLFLHFISKSLLLLSLSHWGKIRLQPHSASWLVNLSMISISPKDCHQRSPNFFISAIITFLLDIININVIYKIYNISLMSVRCMYIKDYSLIMSHYSTCINRWKNGWRKQDFYEKLERTYDKIAKYNVNIILGDFNGKIGRIQNLGRTVGNYGRHETTNDNGYRVVDFATNKNTKIVSPFNTSLFI